MNRLATDPHSRGDRVVVEKICKYRMPVVGLEFGRPGTMRLNKQAQLAVADLCGRRTQRIARAMRLAQLNAPFEACTDFRGAHHLPGMLSSDDDDDRHNTATDDSASQPPSNRRNVVKFATPTKLRGWWRAGFLKMPWRCGEGAWAGA